VVILCPLYTAHRGCLAENAPGESGSQTFGLSAEVAYRQWRGRGRPESTLSNTVWPPDSCPSRRPILARLPTCRPSATIWGELGEGQRRLSRICDALRAAGIEVWFDQSELRGGDAWDRSIRKQIKTCALFIPVISHTTHDRREGYFRLEWKLAVDRSHLMDADMAFLLPVVIDDTRDDDERVPERFREVQWTRLLSGITPPAFVERVRRLLSEELLRGPYMRLWTAGSASVLPCAA
jgi:hypothetical protein